MESDYTLRFGFKVLIKSISYAKQFVAKSPEVPLLVLLFFFVAFCLNSVNALVLQYAPLVNHSGYI